MSRDLLEPEFGTYSSWLVEAIGRLDPGERIPAACRGTGRPALLEDLARLLRLRGGIRMLDIGSGLGGPAAWAVQRHRCHVMCLDVMELEVGGSVRLFPELRGIVAAASALPLRSGSIDAAWALGVVEMVPERQRSIAEVTRVLKPGARFGIYGFFKARGDVPFHPAANVFDRPDAVVEMLENEGLRLVYVAPATPASTPVEWSSPVRSVRATVRREHAGEDALMVAETQLGSFNWLRLNGQIKDWVMVSEKPGG